MVIVCNRSLFNKYGWMAFVCYFENSKGTSMTKDEALRLALDALECWQRNEDCNEPRSKIIGAIKAALEAKDEPQYIAFMDTPQRTWVGLTDEEITELHHKIKVQLMGTYKTEDIYRAIEAKLKEKNK
jgi:hypothetical protein